MSSKKTLWPFVILLLFGVFFAGNALGRSTDMHKVAKKNRRRVKEE
jgi:hypothetical protein